MIGDVKVCHNCGTVFIPRFFDPDRECLIFDGHTISLTRQQCQIAFVLDEYDTISLSEMVENIYEYYEPASAEDVIKVQIYTLRQLLVRTRLEIECIYMKGYRWAYRDFLK